MNLVKIKQRLKELETEMDLGDLGCQMIENAVADLFDKGYLHEEETERLMGMLGVGVTFELDKPSGDFFDKAFTNPVTGNPYVIPPRIRKISEHICRHYSINGVCDPMYIANMVGMCFNVGDGRGHFDNDVALIDPSRLKHLVGRIMGAYGCIIGKGDAKILASIIKQAAI